MCSYQSSINKCTTTMVSICRSTVGIFFTVNKGSDAGTHASGRAGQHFELFDSILDTVKNVTAHNHRLRVQYVR